MGRFFNKTRTPFSATTTKGHAITFPPRGWAYVPINEESSQAIQNYVRKGMLARADAPEDAVLMAAASAPALPALAPKPVLAAPIVAAIVVPTAPEPAPVEDPVAVEDSITSAVSQEVSDPSEESVALDDPSVADSLPRKPRRR